MNVLLVLGATGLMGKRICRLAHKTIPDVRIIGASRSKPADMSLIDDWRPARIDDSDGLMAALNGVDVTINAVGPFEYDPDPLLATCAASNCHYVDIAETPHFIHHVNQVAAAWDNGLAAISGCSTIPGLVDVFTQRWADQADVTQIDVYLTVGTANDLSATLMTSMLRPIGRRCPDGGRYFTKLRTKKPLTDSTRVVGRYPSSYDGGSIQVGDRSIPCHFYFGFDRKAYGVFIWMCSPFLPLVPGGLLTRGCSAATLVNPITKCLGTTVGILNIEGRSSNGDLIEEVQIRASDNGLDVPALPSVWAAERLMAGKFTDQTRRDQPTFATLVDDQYATEGLERDGFQVKIQKH